MSELLRDFAIDHAALRPVAHPRLGVTIDGQSAVRYLRFLQPVRLDRLELSPTVYGRWVPDVPTHPARLRVSTLEETTGAWVTVRIVDLPPDPRIEGIGLDQAMTIEAMNQRFAAILRDPPHVVPLDGLVTDHLKVECDAEHPVWPSHGECNGSPHQVPFGILSTLKAFGETKGDAFPEALYRPILTKETIQPEAPAGMRVRHLPDRVVFESPRLRIGFSLIRPMLLELGWDAFGKPGTVPPQRLLTRRSGITSGASGSNGPLLRTLREDLGAHRWTGTVRVEGNRVRYEGLQATEGVTLDATFTVEADRVAVEIVQRCARTIPVVEAEAWRFLWDLSVGITGAAAVPTRRPGRNGEVETPLLWATDAHGCLAVQTDGRYQVESYRSQSAVSGGFVLAPAPGPDACLVLPEGERRLRAELSVTALEPAGEGAPAEGVATRWSTVFSCFRPEHGGFSNHSASTHCHLSQATPMELVAHTKPPAVGPDPIALGRFTIERALLGGGGYGYHRNLYLDSDPALLCAAGRLHQARPDPAWLARIAPGVTEATARILASIGDDGLVVCHDLSGDTNSHRWSCNSMDVVGFGHIDAYVNAWSYRALRNAQALLGSDLAVAAGQAADRLCAAYAPALVNPATGWVAGWRSRDGQLHDYAFLYINGIAIAFGLLDDAAAQTALNGLEALRERVGPGTARMGLPGNLLPIAPGDHMLRQLISPLEPTFEMYTDGSLSGWFGTYYLRALSLYGDPERARALAAEIDAGYADGVFDGGHGSGVEFRSWEGLPTGYEGTLIGCFGGLYALAIAQGALVPTTPEWWPSSQSPQGPASPSRMPPGSRK